MTAGLNITESSMPTAHNHRHAGHLQVWTRFEVLTSDDESIVPSLCMKSVLRLGRIGDDGSPLSLTATLTSSEQTQRVLRRTRYVIGKAPGLF